MYKYLKDSFWNMITGAASLAAALLLADGKLSVGDASGDSFLFVVFACGYIANYLIMIRRAYEE